MAEILTREPLDDSSAAIVHFQRRLIAQQETGRQLISSALRPPAARPHASYSQVRRETGGLGGFFRRLLGRG